MDWGGEEATLKYIISPRIIQDKAFKGWGSVNYRHVIKIKIKIKIKIQMNPYLTCLSVYNFLSLLSVHHKLRWTAHGDHNSCNRVIKCRRHNVRLNKVPDKSVDFTVVGCYVGRILLLSRFSFSFCPLKTLSSFPPACSLLQLWAISFLCPFSNPKFSILKSQVDQSAILSIIICLFVWGFGGN